MDFRHWMAEKMVRRKHETNNQELPSKFWNLPQYKKEYQHQIRCAAKILKIYDKQIIEELLEREKWIYSLALKRLSDMLEELKIEKEKENSSIIEFSEQKDISFRKR